MAAPSRSLIMKVVKNSNYSTITLVGRAKSETVSELTNAIPELLTPPQDVILNCQDVLDLSSAWVRGLLQLGQQLKLNAKQLRLINASDSLVQFLKQEGVHDGLRSCDSLNKALIECGLQAPKALDVNFINPFLVAVVKVLELQASTKAVAGKLYTKPATEKLEGDLSGVIGLVSDVFTGSVVITFPTATFLKVMSRMLGEDYTEVTQEIEDGAGELTNIIFGTAKSKLNEQGFGIKTAIPSVITGAHHTIIQQSSGPRVVVPFDSDAGSFAIEICLEN